MSFCVYMLGSRHDAEDALQATFASAHRALLADSRPMAVRPWLFAIARNECIGILRKRRPTAELNGEPAKTGDPVRHLELSEEVRIVVEDVRQLPERQRAALVLAELDGLTHAEIATVLGVRAEQVKAYMYQARTNLISERRAREADCLEIREELASARGAALRRTRIRRHTRSCVACRAYADSVKHQQRQLAALLPIAPTLGLKYRILEQLFGIGASGPDTYAGGVAIGSTVTAALAELAGGGMKALAVKLTAGALALGATAEVGVSMLKATSAPSGATQSASTSTNRARTRTSSVSTSAARSGSAAAGGLTSARAAKPQPAAVGRAPGGSPGQQPASPGATTGAPGTEAPAPRSDGEGGHGGSPREAPNATAPGGPPEVEHAGPSNEQWQGTAALRHGEHERLRAERVRAREERKTAREAAAGEAAPPPPAEEEPPEVGLSGSPKRTPQERQERREEHERRHKEREEQRAAGG